MAERLAGPGCIARAMAKTALALAAATAGTGGQAQVLADQVSGCLGAPPTATINANPSNYRTLLPTLTAGQRLLLAAGTYTQDLPIASLNGAQGQCIVIEGPAGAPRAVFQARACCNTISLTDSSYIAIRHLDVTNPLAEFVDAVKAESPSVSVHHVLLEDLHIVGFGVDQQEVGISTKCPAWNWAIRLNTIEGAGTGLYLGNSDGSAEFVGGLIEHNLVRDTLGYNMQIKHQTGRIGAAPASARTVVRHNVFSKASGASAGGNARPNLLVGHWPLSGPGSTDMYEIYGNFFFQNPVEALFQGEGNVSLYDNLFFDDQPPTAFPATAIQPQNDVPKDIRIFHNTVVARGVAINVTGGSASFTQRVVANLALAETGAPPIVGGTQANNLSDTYANRGTYLQNPSLPIPGLNLFPRLGVVTGPLPDMTPFQTLRDWDRDFNGTLRGSQFRGGYAGEGSNPGWPLAIAIKGPGDVLPVELQTFQLED